LFTFRITGMRENDEPLSKHVVFYSL